VRKKRAKKGGGSGWGSVENGVPLAKCDHVDGEKSSCQDFLSLSLSLSPFPAIFLDFYSKRRVAEKFLWAGLPGPPLRAALAKKRGGEKRDDERSGSAREREAHPSIGIKRVTSPWGEIESERATRRDVTRCSSEVDPRREETSEGDARPRLPAMLISLL